MIQIDETKVTNKNDTELIRNASRDCEFCIIFVGHFRFIDLDHFSYHFSVLAICSVYGVNSSYRIFFGNRIIELRTQSNILHELRGYYTLTKKYLHRSG